MRDIKNNAKVTTPTAPALVTYNHKAGPRSDVSQTCPLWTRTESDWRPEYNLLWVSQNNGYYAYKPIPDQTTSCVKRYNIGMFEQDIVSFVKETVDRYDKMTVVVLTRNASGMNPRRVMLRINKNSGTSITTSCGCTKEDIDKSTQRLIQRILDTLGISINFGNCVSNWNDNDLNIVA